MHNILSVKDICNNAKISGINIIYSDDQYKFKKRIYSMSE